MKKLIIFQNLIVLLFCTSCQKEVFSEQGGIDIISNVYFDASKGLDNTQNFHLSRINYSKDIILELVPDIALPAVNTEIFYIKDSLYYSLGKETGTGVLLSDLIKGQKPKWLENKTEGALFSRDLIPNYKNRRNLSDTVLFRKKYKRFEVNSPWNYTRFYIFKTDTILPYSLYKHAERDYHGRLERIDSYNKRKDIFVTLQLIPRKKWDGEAKEIFDFNDFAKKKNNEVK
jgi:hypothetical protein